MIDTFSADTRPGKIKIIMDKLENGVKNLLQSDKYKEYLSIMSKFHNYSFCNTVLIATQKPNATYVAGLQSWNKNFKRFVNKGEKGIVILAPAPYKKKVEQKVLDENGNEITETKTIKIQSFKPTYVYDISQTHGKPLPSISVNELNGNVDNYGKLFKIIKEISPADVSFEKISTGAKGYYDQRSKRIAISEGMSELQNIKTLIHETAHAMLHDKDYLETTGEQKDRFTKEVEAESVAYTVCSYLNLPTEEYSFGYIAGWSGQKRIDAVRESLETIKECSSNIIGELEKRLVLDKSVQLTAEVAQEEQSKALVI